jgi:hypothetical protein
MPQPGEFYLRFKNRAGLKALIFSLVDLMENEGLEGKMRKKAMTEKVVCPAYEKGAIGCDSCLHRKPHKKIGGPDQCNYQGVMCRKCLPLPRRKMGKK